MLPNGYPLADRAASLHILCTESASLFETKLQGGCAVGEALAVGGDVREKPAPSSSMGKKKGRRNEQRHGPHSHALPLCHQAGSTQCTMDLHKHRVSLPQTKEEGGVGAGAGMQ